MKSDVEQQLFLDRELSWLAFNERVLEEATDGTTPLLERVRFVAIAASNLDEFFMVRVAGLMRRIDEGDTTPEASGLTAAAQLAAVTERCRRFVEALCRCTMIDLLPALESHGIRIIPVDGIDGPRQAWLRSYFRDSVLPVLTPLAIDAARPFPLLSSLSLNIAVLLDEVAGDDGRRLAIVQVPLGLARLVKLSAEGTNFVLLEDVIRANLSELFPGQAIRDTAVIRLARDAEIELDDEGGRTHLEAVEHQVRQRRRSDVVRLEVEQQCSDELLKTLCEQIDMDDEDVYRVPGILDLRVLAGLADLPGYDALRNPAVSPVDVLSEDPDDLFSILDRRDVLLHHPYDSYDPVVSLVAEAAEDPDVLAIKQTLYRTSPGSPIIASLQKAAERNKQVTVLLELTARFDEERNIQWARALESAGAHVIYGVRRFKTHAKITLIVRRTARGLRRYVHLGTGNYNERTARIYTDFGLMTASPAIAQDASAFFNALTGYSDPPRLKKLVMAPTGLRQRFVKLIDRERRRAASGQPAEIVAKMNSLIDEEIISALYAASAARRPDRAQRPRDLRAAARRSGLEREHRSDLDPRSVPGAFAYLLLPQRGHRRGVSLERGLDDAGISTAASSCCFRFRTGDHHQSVVYALRAMFRDNVKARVLGPDGVYVRRQRAADEPAFRVQEHLQHEAHRRAALARERAGVTLIPEAR